jgi:hypothetical protein
MTNNIVSNFQTPVAQNSRVDYLWSHPAGDRDANLWSNVEFVYIFFNIRTVMEMIYKNHKPSLVFQQNSLQMNSVPP